MREPPFGVVFLVDGKDIEKDLRLHTLMGYYNFILYIQMMEKLVKLVNKSKSTYNGIAPGRTVNVTNAETYLIHGFVVVGKVEVKAVKEEKTETKKAYKKMNKTELLEEVTLRGFEEKGVELEGNEKNADLVELLEDDDAGKFDGDDEGNDDG
jgi:hypothetical protein